MTRPKLDTLTILLFVHKNSRNMLRHVVLVISEIFKARRLLARTMGAGEEDRWLKVGNEVDRTMCFLHPHLTGNGHDSVG